MGVPGVEGGHGISMGGIPQPLGLKDLGFPLGSHSGSQGVPNGGTQASGPLGTPAGYTTAKYGIGNI